MRLCISAPFLLPHVALSLCAQVPIQVSDKSQFKVQSLYQFPDGTWLENLAVRHNGQVLVTSLTPEPSVYLFYDENAPPLLLHTFTDVTSLLGITEYAKDIFGIAGGNFSLSPRHSELGSYSIYRLDLAEFEISSKGTVTRPARVSKLAPVPNAQILNGLSMLDADTILAADSFEGVVYAIDTFDRTVDVAINDTLMHPPPGEMKLGINGIHHQQEKLYFSNSGFRLIGEIPMHVNGTAGGQSKRIATALVDDFCFGIDDNIYAASNQDNMILRIIPSTGVVTRIAGHLNSSLVTGPSSIKHGRGKEGTLVLYVTTSGGTSAPVNGTYTEGGRLLKLTPE
jgi:hypothetical protein